MKIPIIAIVLLAIGSVGLQAQTLTTAASQGNVPAPTDYQIVQQDGNSRVWQREIYEQEPNGQIVARPHKFTELATGLNYKDLSTGQWQPSKEEIDIQPDGTLSATQGQHQVYFPGNIYGGEIELVTPDGVQLHSCPVALSYDDGANTVLIGVLTNSIGQLVGSNQVIYTNAFVGLDADLIYSYTRSGLEQDVVLREQPPTPASLGLNPDTTRLQVLTEFFDPPQPVQTTSNLPEQAGLALTDDTLDFGTMQMVPGKAFKLGEDSPSARVGKSWVILQGRQFLVEAVPVAALAEQLESLPAPSAQTASTAKARMISRNLILPPQHLAKAGVPPLKLARTGISRKPGVVLDYLTVNSSLTNYTFQGSTTYYISGTTYSYGTNIFEGGTVIKYASSGEICIQPHPGTTPSVTFEASAYRPVIFTAKDDNSVGDAISGSTGSPSGYYGTMLDIAGFSLAGALTDFRMAYADTGISCSGVSANFYNAQFLHCQNPFDFAGATVGLRNALFSNNATNFDLGGGASVNAQNVTFNGASCLAMGPTSPEDVTLTLTNCILSGESKLTNGYMTIGGADNGFYENPEFGSGAVTNNFYPFQTVGGGEYYLTNGCSFHNVGTTNIDPVLLANLAAKTTYPPIAYTNVTFSTATTFSPQAQRDYTGAPDLGYHYDPIDYSFGGCFADANLTFTNGTAVGWFRTSSGWEHAGYGIDMGAGVTVLFSGTAIAPDYWVRLNTVQEQDYTAGYGQAGIETWVNSDLPTVSGQFLRCSAMAGELRSYFSDDYGSIQARMVNSEFWGGSLDAYGDYMYFTNCLMQRVDMELWNGSAGNARITWDCTFFGGEYDIERTSGGSAFVSVRNSAFDGTSISTSDYYGSNPTYSDYDYNAYTNSTDPFSIGGANDVTGVSFNWESSWFGDFYLPSDSSLIEKGSTNANFLGLYYFTTQTNQTIEGDSPVDIGYHYVATDQYGNPLATFNDGIPDYLDDPNGNGLPNWWTMEYFGNTDESATNQDSFGNTLLSDYQSSSDPNILQFISIQVTNNYVKSSSVAAQLNVSGLPYYIAVCVDDTNYEADAVWNTYSSSNIMVNLGSTEGWHSVWVGLRAHADDPSAASWCWRRLKLMVTPPVLVVTNPTVNTVKVPLVQIQGYSPEELANISYDLSNAVAVVTNQDAGVTRQFYNTNSFEFTTNYFECVDVPLTNGVNLITLHATDMAGNTATTNISITLNYATATNPVVQLTWPQDGAEICQTNFILRGWVDDPTATILAEIVDTNGDTNIVTGEVERTGVLWVHNLPLAEGTNNLTLWVTNAAGYSSATNINVVKNDMTLAVTSLTSLSGDLWNPTVSVSGNISDPTAGVSVNGVEGVNNGDGTWDATNVPVSTGGVANFDVTATPDDGSTDTASMSTNKQDEIIIVSAIVNVSLNFLYPDGSSYEETDDQPWMRDQPYEGNLDQYWSSGTYSLQQITCPPSPSGTGMETEVITTWDGTTLTAVTNSNPWEGGIPVPANNDEGFAENDVMAPWPADYNAGGTCGEVTQTSIHLVTGGEGVSQRQNLFHITCPIYAYDPLPYYFNFSGTHDVPPQNVTMGSLGNLDSNGNLWKVLPDNDERDMTPNVPGENYYYYSPGEQKYSSSFTVFVRQPYPDYPNDLIDYPDGPPLGYPIYNTQNGVQAGHAWWVLINNAPLSAINKFTTPTCSEWLNEQVGYAYLSASFISYFPPIKSGPGTIDLDNGSAYSISRTYAIGFQGPGLIDGLNYTEKLKNFPGTWNSKTHNCVNETSNTGNAVGVSLPVDDGTPESFGFTLPPSTQ
jgi:hypothetical protein